MNSYVTGRNDFLHAYCGLPLLPTAYNAFTFVALDLQISFL